MRIVQVNNFHRTIGGSDIAARDVASLLRRQGHNVTWLSRDSNEMGRGLHGRLEAFLGGFVSSSACRDMVDIIERVRPDVAHVHEVYPLISPWVLHVCSRRLLPVVMSCHNCRFTCPTAHHYRQQRPCELCAGGREYWCLLTNCRENIFESAAYACRSVFARNSGILKRAVTLFIAPSRFVMDRMIHAGYAACRIRVLPNFIAIPERPAVPSTGKYCLFVGRVTPEKGVTALLSAAQATRLPIRLAGDCSSIGDTAVSTAKVKFLGVQHGDDLAQLYRNARCLVLPSTCLEVNPLAVCEAMSYGLPVIASRIGGVPELVTDEVTGLLVEPGNADDLKEKMQRIWEDDSLCDRLGHAARQKAMREYGEGTFYQGLMRIYMDAIRAEKMR